MRITSFLITKANKSFDNAIIKQTKKFENLKKKHSMSKEEEKIKIKIYERFLTHHHTKDKIRESEETYTLVSFDVVSLYTKIHAKEVDMQ